MDFFKGRTNGFAATEYYSGSRKKVHENRPQSIFMCPEEEKILKPGVLSGSVCFSDSSHNVPWSEVLTMPPSHCLQDLPVVTHHIGDRSEPERLIKRKTTQKPKVLL